MTPARHTPADALPVAWPATAVKLQSAAFVLLLVCLAVRPFLSEMTYRTPSVPGSFVATDAKAPAPNDLSAVQPSRMELYRV